MNSISLQIAQQTRDIHSLLFNVAPPSTTLAQPLTNNYSCILFAERPNRDITLSSPGGALVPNDRETGTLQTRLL